VNVVSGVQPARPSASGAPDRHASLWRRYAALGYEGLLLAAIVLVVGFLTLPAVPSTEGDGRALAVPPFPARVLSACFVFAAAGLYCTWSWTGGRRTLPMKTWRLAIVRADGRTVDAKRAVARYVAAWIGPAAALVAYAALQPANLGTHAMWLAAIGYLWPLVDPDRQFLHDRIAGTRIVTASPDPSPGAPARPPR
jgi:uncharacterized RDD family membrane protein YckC